MRGEKGTGGEGENGERRRGGMGVRT